MNDPHSTYRGKNAGVPQESVLGSFLFIISQNDNLLFIESTRASNLMKSEVMTVGTVDHLTRQSEEMRVRFKGTNIN